MTLQEIESHIEANLKAGRPQFDGLSSSDIGKRSRALMFGENDEAFPSQDHWSRITD